MLIFLYESMKMLTVVNQLLWRLAELKNLYRLNYTVDVFYATQSLPKMKLQRSMPVFDNISVHARRF